MSLDLSISIVGFVCGNPLTLDPVTVRGLPDGVTLDRAWFTVKRALADADAVALIHKRITADDVADQGQIVDDGGGTAEGSTAGVAILRFQLTAADTARLVGDTTYYCDVKVRTSGGEPHNSPPGTISGKAAVTRATE